MYVSPPSSCYSLPSLHPEKSPGLEEFREGLFVRGRGRRDFAAWNAAGLSGT